MNTVEVKLGQRAKLNMPTQPHEGVCLGDELIIVGVPIVLCKCQDGHLERFAVHELKEVEEKERK